MYSFTHMENILCCTIENSNEIKFSMWKLINVLGPVDLLCNRCFSIQFPRPVRFPNSIIFCDCEIWK